MRMKYWAATLLAVLLLASGCDGAQTVNGENTRMPMASTSPSSSTAAAESSPTPAPSISPIPTKPTPYSFPMRADALCGGAALPDGFFRPLWIAADGSMFLYSTTDGRIERALWNGVDYSQAPVVEGVDAQSLALVYMDAAGSRLCCKGGKLFPDSRRGPAAVIVDLTTGARCNADDLSGWEQKNRALSGDFQYGNGLILAQVEEYKDDAYSPLDRWVLVNLADKSYTSLNMESILKRCLPEGQTSVSYRLALTGSGKLLAACLVQEKAETETGAYSCIAFELDLEGRLQSSKAVTSAGKKPEECELPRGTLFDASHDGKYLLYSNAQGSGIYLCDVAAGVEYEVLSGTDATRIFAQWSPDGTIYYGSTGKTESREITIHKTSANDIIGKK